MIDRKLNYGRHILLNIVDSIVFSDKSVCLDLGAGKGDDLNIIKSKHNHCSTVAVENYIPNIEYLKSIGHKVISSNIENDILPFDDESVDMIIANQILEHCKEIFWIFHEISRVLKINGYLYIGVPNLASLHSRILLFVGMQPTCIRSNSAHVRGFTKPDIINFIDSIYEHGYKLEAFYGSNFYPCPPRLARLLSYFFPTMSATIFFRLKKIRNYENQFLKYPVGLETNFYVGNPKG